MQRFMKYAGAKEALVPEIIPHIPAPRSPNAVYHEPFLGSGVIAGFLADDAKRKQYVFALNDSNADLIWVYRHLIFDLHDLFTHLQDTYTAGRDAYYQYRTEFNSLPAGSVRKSALFMYLNRFDYNGLCRYNQSGQFNAPVGTHNSYYFPQVEMNAWAAWLRYKKNKVTLLAGDFADATFSVAKFDVVYLDPPYYPVSSTANFVGYGGKRWISDQDHIRLADEALRCANLGATVIISNANVSFVTELYTHRGARVIELPPVKRSIQGGANGTAKEILAVWA